MKISSQQQFYGVDYRKLQNRNRVENTKTLNNPQNNVNFKSAADTTAFIFTTAALGVAAVSGLIYGLKTLLEKLNMKSTSTEISVDNSKYAEGAQKADVITSDIDDFEIVDRIKILQLPVPSVRETGFAGFMYKGKPYTTKFFYNNRASLKIGILNKLSKLEPENENYYKSMISDLEKNDEEKRYLFNYPHTDISAFADSKLQARKLNIGNIKFLQFSDPEDEKLGCVAFIYCGCDLTASFSENSPEAIEEAIKNKIAEFDRK